MSASPRAPYVPGEPQYTGRFPVQPAPQGQRVPLAIAVLATVAALFVGGAVGAVAVRLRTPAAAATPAAPADPATTQAADPYGVYQRLAPAGAPRLSREDAQARALLGCGQQWAPGTVDAALAEAYAGLCKGP